MAAQLSDSFFFNGIDHALAGVSEGALWYPTNHGLRPRMASTACYRGYQCVFALRDGQLVVQSLKVNLREEVDEKFRDVEGPVLNGVRPTGRVNAHDLFNNHYPALDLPLQYTGGALIAEGFHSGLYAHMGFPPAWKYSKVAELTFENGVLQDVSDRSARMATMRRELAARAADTSRLQSEVEIGKFMSQAFDRRYAQ